MPYFTTKEKGSGLGLAIVEKTVDEMGGQLLISSKEGSGTTVTISLPCAE
jgi:two-component system sensor histidine kinase HydH